ncbi:MAG: flagellar basal body P-ring formation chaperone FlgA [Gammaproteobacteria bacterium]|nr:flagellar basal body P-ring formation chaperone FlgA [Gammaproteobacteria bacterium]MDH5800513.1 flagellar basal body P-ring formation chaperone FlgA [Gammaproteobacteria bacterium]
MKCLQISYILRVVVAILSTSFSCSPSVHAKSSDPQYHKLDDISLAAERAVHQHMAQGGKTDYEFEIYKPNTRLKLRLCSKALVAEVAGRELTGKATIKVQCKDNKPWKLFVSAEIAYYELVPVSTTGIARGQQISAAQIENVRVRLTNANKNVLSSDAAIIGKVAKRYIAKGKTFSPQLLAEPKLVRRGQQVVLIAKNAALEVRMSGKALADGARGDIIKVRNNSSNRVVEGIVTRLGIVQIQM